MIFSSFVYVFVITYNVGTISSQSLTNTIHKTQAASEKRNDLRCYACNSMESGGGDVCIENITHINNSQYTKKCRDNEFICIIKKFSYTTSTENATSNPKLWSLERNCTANCESGCIVIGERTKLYACTSCCNTSYCNSGTGIAIRLQPYSPKMPIILVISILTLIYYN